MKKSQYESSNKTKSRFVVPSGIINLTQSFVVAVCISLVLYLFVFTPNQVKGNSMSPNLESGEVVLTNKMINWLGNTTVGQSLGFTYSRGDIIVFQKPGFDDFIKRIIALPGERVAIRDGYVYVNNNRIVEDYLPPATFTSGGTFIEEAGEGKVVGEDEFFVLGDNRGESLDSRYNEIGFIKKDWLKGKVILIYWPLSKLSIVNTGEIEIITN